MIALIAARVIEKCSKWTNLDGHFPRRLAQALRRRDMEKLIVAGMERSLENKK